MIPWSPVSLQVPKRPAPFSRYRGPALTTLRRAPIRWSLVAWRVRSPRPLRPSWSAPWARVRPEVTPSSSTPSARVWPSTREVHTRSPTRSRWLGLVRPSEALQVGGRCSLKGSRRTTRLGCLSCPFPCVASMKCQKHVFLYMNCISLLSLWSVQWCLSSIPWLSDRGMTMLGGPAWWPLGRCHRGARGREKGSVGAPQPTAANGVYWYNLNEVKRTNDQL